MKLTHSLINLFHPFPPSQYTGHSSWAASGLGFLTFYLMGQTRAMAGSGRAWRLFVSIIPALVAIIVGVTRITDYWHHVSDVCVGLVLGFGVSLIVYKQLYPWFYDENCHQPLYRAHGASNKRLPN